MSHQDISRSTPPQGYVRTLRQQEELPLLRDHLLRLDRESRHDRFHGFMDDAFIERYSAKCAEDGTVIIGYFEGEEVRGAAELHPPDQSADAVPEIAFSVEASMRRRGVGIILFRKLIAESRARGYQSLRITTGAQNQAMRALAHKFGAHLSFRHGETTGTIDLTQLPQPAFAKPAFGNKFAKPEFAKPEFAKPEFAKSGFAGPAVVTPADAARAIMDANRAYWQLWMRMYGWSRTA